MMTITSWANFAGVWFPHGTAVKFSPAEGPHLAVLSHGSSGYGRSVLLIYDPKGNLVWQEELKKLSTIIAVPGGSGLGEVLLIGGIDGIIAHWGRTKATTCTLGCTLGSDQGNYMKYQSNDIKKGRISRLKPMFLVPKWCV